MATIDLTGNVIEADSFLGNVTVTTLTVGGVAVTATAAELNYVDTAAGTSAPSKALVLDANEELDWTYASAAAANVEPLNLDTTLSGIGATGGRAKFTLTTNVALGAWSNALKAEVTYGASGRTDGLGSSFVAEMTLSAGTSSGTYAPVEIELNLGTGALTGTATSLLYASVNGADKATFDTSGYLMTVAGVTAGAAKMFSTIGTTAALADFTHGLRVKVGGADYFIPLITAAEFAS